MLKIKRGFTLIELLIVVAIIAILAAIALPNFIEAQTRSKVARAKADIRSMATAIEAYCVDHNTYPPYSNPADKMIGGLCALTTPVSFMTEIPRDPFGASWYPHPDNPHASRRWGFYELGSGKANVRSSGAQPFSNDTWMLECDGPDGYDDTSPGSGVNLSTSGYPWVHLTGTPQEMEVICAMAYDPTNGTISRGEIYRVGGVRPDSPPLRLLHDLSRR